MTVKVYSYYPFKLLDDIERILIPVERGRLKAHRSLAWDQVSCPTRREGAFGIKRVHEWNTTSVLKHWPTPPIGSDFPE